MLISDIVSLQNVFPNVLYDRFSVKSHDTRSAFIWFLFRMSFQMSVKITIWWKSLYTLPALIWFLPSVYFNMTYNIYNLQKSLATLIALQWFLPSMSSYVQVENTQKYKSVWCDIHFDNCSQLNDLLHISHCNSISPLVNSGEVYFSVALL